MTGWAEIEKGYQDRAADAIEEALRRTEWVAVRLRNAQGSSFGTMDWTTSLGNAKACLEFVEQSINEAVGQWYKEGFAKEAAKVKDG